MTSLPNSGERTDQVNWLRVMALIGFINRRTNMDIEQVEMAQVSTAIELNVKRFLETAGKERRITAAYLYGSHVLTVTALDRPGHAATKTETK